MTDNDDEIDIMALMKRAHGLIQSAEDMGLLARGSASSGISFWSARSNVLAHALATVEKDDWLRKRATSADWELSDRFGSLVRLAIFELTHDHGLPNAWLLLRDLFRHYFGPDMEPLLPSVFLAAATHPAVIMDASCLAGMQQIIRELSVGERAWQSLERDDFL